MIMVLNSGDRFKALALVTVTLGVISLLSLIHSTNNLSKEDAFLVIWREYGQSDDFKKIRKMLIEDLKNEIPFEASKCPRNECSSCPSCPSCAKEKKCPEASCHSSPVSESNKSWPDLAFKYLVTDFEPVSVDPDLDKFDYEPFKTPSPKCASDPSLDSYIHKPPFSRDQFDYDTKRDGYTPRRLVCDESSSHELKETSKYWLEECDDVEPLSSVVSVVGSNLTDTVLDKLAELGLSVSKKSKTPYVLVLSDVFDFDSTDANIWRMVREAENQNADVVAGSWRDEKGHWTSSCLHYSLQNYTLHVWDGYYKSIGSMKYCDMSLGPLLVRREQFDDQLLSREVDKRIDFHLRRPSLRVLACLDCMFYQSTLPLVTKESFSPLAYVYTLNVISHLARPLIRFLRDDFEFTCPEAGITCDIKYYDSAGLAQPPCCLRILTGMTLAVLDNYQKESGTVCLYCGQVLAALKMPGGQLPWDTDVDMPMMAAGFEHAVNDIVTEQNLSKYGLKAQINKSRQQPNEIGEVEGGMVVIRHEVSNYSMDNYAKAPSKLKCGHQVTDQNRPETKIMLDGVWVPGPDNPGAYGRTYGDEIYRHVLHVKSTKSTYNDQDAEFRTCDKPPQHACLADYPADGNIQFRGDLHGLRPLN